MSNKGPPRQLIASIATASSLTSDLYRKAEMAENIRQRKMYTLRKEEEAKKEFEEDKREREENLKRQKEKKRDQRKKKMDKNKKRTREDDAEYCDVSIDIVELDAPSDT
eukprot:Tbor_TRINITY_DN5677_c1_g2::TRINITY_DN5677_c1_g2_i1::g.9101::m.9101